MMTRLTLTALAALVSCTMMAQAPAFPGAEGHGRYVTGGRGGEVVHVTNLNDSGTGSLRSAVSKPNRIVVFDVAGVIALKGNLFIKDNITIEGQTAPSPGITVRYYTVEPKGNNIIIRFMRFRRGQEKNVNDGADAITSRHYTGMMLDHCSISWSIDELASFYDNNNFTMQWCMLGEALANAGHGKGAHSYGGIWGGKLASFHHNYLGFMQNRVPRFCGARYKWTGYNGNKKYSEYNWHNPVQAENVDLRNCVMYNWGNGGCYGGPGGGYVNIVNNYYKAGPGTKSKTRVTTVTVAASGNASGEDWCFGMTSRYFINGNYVSAAGANARNYDWKGVEYDNGTRTINGEVCSIDTGHYYGQGVDSIKYKKSSDGLDCVSIKLNAPGAPLGEVTTQTAETAYEKVLSYSGASLYRDDVDTRYVRDTRDGTTTYLGSKGTTNKGIIDIVADCNGYTEETKGWGLTKSTRKDSDNDGMPDDFETANGLDPTNAADAKAYTIDSKANGGKGWYTNIEVYCNSLVEDIMKAGNEDAISSVDEYYPIVKKTSTALSQAVTDDAPVSSKYYAPDGSEIRNINSYNGLLVRVDTLKNGRNVASKLIR